MHPAINNSDKGSGNTLQQVVKPQGKINCPQYLDCIKPRYKTKGEVVYLLLTTPYKGINEIIRGDYSIDKAEKPLQSMLLEELLCNIKMEKKELIQNVITTDSTEMKECLCVGAFKACLILCGSILEAVLLDWLSEIEDTNYFVDDVNLQIDLTGVIERLKNVFYPNWNNEANKAHEIRLMRNLIHPVKCVVKQTEINEEVCLQILEKLQDILTSRGLETIVKE